MDLQQCTKDLEKAKEKAQQFELLSAGVNRLPIPLHIIDTMYTVLYTNESTAALVGKKQEEIIGKKCYDIYRSSACNTPDCPCRVAMEKGILHHCEIPLGEIVIDVTGLPVTDSAGTVIGAIEYFPEVTAQKNAVAEILNVAEKAKNGDLSARTDPAQHTGDFQKMTVGINNILDAVIGPLNLAADYIERIGKGDIPEKSTRQVNGDFNTLKNNLNNCIDNINALVADADMLSVAAVKGRLATRADATRHQGDYRKIVEGVNQTLDAVIEPVNEAMRVANEFAQYNYTARVDKNLRVAGDFVRFRDALDNIGITVSTAIRDIGVQVTDLAASAEEANVSVEEVVSWAQQVAESAGKVSSNAEKGNLGLEQVLKAMEDLFAAVEEVTANTEAVATLANDANTLSKDGAELARKAEQGMVGITRSTTEVEQIIGEINSEMQKIGKIVGLISDLASQTNLLALNAAIEAARAGDAGRGFAVVAAEVKSLAQESRTSAESIAEMIGGSSRSPKWPPRRPLPLQMRLERDQRSSQRP